MSETFLALTSLKLIGRIVEDLELKPKATQQKGHNNFLQVQFPGGSDQNSTVRVAHIYAFTYNGQYFEMTSPTLFLVHGKGDKLSADTVGPPQRQSAPAADLFTWTYDKGDFAVRLDVSTGPLEQILLGIDVGIIRGAGGNVGGNVGTGVGGNVGGNVGASMRGRSDR